MKIKREEFYLNLILLILLFINNILATPLILYSFFYRKWKPFLVSIWFSIWAYFFIPYKNSDLDRYYKLFEDIFTREIILKNQKDIFAKNIINLILNLNIPKEWLAFIACFICYYFFLKAFYILNENSLNKNCYLIIYLFSIPITCYHGVRFYPALSIFIFSIVLKLKEKNKRAIMFMLISVCIHTSMILPIIIYLFYYFVIKNKISERKIKILGIIGCLVGLILDGQIIFCSFKILYNIFPFLNKIINLNHLGVYLIGKFGTNILENLSFQGIIAFYVLKILRIIILLLILFLYKDKSNFNKYIYLLCFFALIFANFNTITERIFYVVLYLFLLKNTIKTTETKKNIKKLLLLGICIYNSFLLLMFIRTQHLNIFQSYINILKISFFNILLDIF